MHAITIVYVDEQAKSAVGLALLQAMTVKRCGRFTTTECDRDYGGHNWKMRR